MTDWSKVLRGSIGIPPHSRQIAALGGRTTITSVVHTALVQRDPGFKSIVVSASTAGALPR